MGELKKCELTWLPARLITRIHSSSHYRWLELSGSLQNIPNPHFAFTEELSSWSQSFQLAKSRFSSGPHWFDRHFLGGCGRVVGKAFACMLTHAISPSSSFITLTGPRAMPLYLKLPDISGQKYCFVFNLPQSNEDFQVSQD